MTQNGETSSTAQGQKTKWSNGAKRLIAITTILIALLLASFGMLLKSIFERPEYELIRAETGWFAIYRRGELVSEFKAYELGLDDCVNP